jgi:hypothetical protein
MHRMKTNRNTGRIAPLSLTVLALPLVAAATLSSPAQAQEVPAASRPANAGSRSPLTGASLPAGVQRITQKGVTDAGVSQLKRVADSAGLNLGKTEHFGWKGESYSPSRAESLMKRGAAALEAAGYAYKKVTEKKLDGGGTLVYFLAINQKKNQAVLGCWTVGESFLILNWGEISKAEAPEPDEEPTTGNPGGASGSGAAY